VGTVVVGYLFGISFKKRIQRKGRNSQYLHSFLGTEVFVNPFKTLEEEEAEEQRKEDEEKKKNHNVYQEEGRGNWYSNPAPAPLKTTKTGIGKYLPQNLAPTPPAATPKRKAPEPASAPPAKKSG
jgi:hypothetical protein